MTKESHAAHDHPPLEPGRPTSEEIERALQLAVREALRDHKRAGNPVPIWRNDQVEWVPPEEIPDFPDLPDGEQPGEP